jgi:hypothetical protein
MTDENTVSTLLSTGHTVQQLAQVVMMLCLMVVGASILTSFKRFSGTHLKRLSGLLSTSAVAIGVLMPLWQM